MTNPTQGERYQGGADLHRVHVLLCVRRARVLAHLGGVLLHPLHHHHEAPDQAHDQVPLSALHEYGYVGGNSPLLVFA